MIKSIVCGVVAGVTAMGLAPLVSGCTAAPRRYLMAYDVDIDPRFTVEQQAVVVQAADAWRAAVPGLTLRVSVGACPGATAFCVAPQAGLTGRLGHSEDPGDDRGCVSDISVDQVVEVITATQFGMGLSTGDPDALLRQTVEHELGHCMMGPEHLGNGALMCATANCASMTLTAADLAHFAAVR